jgi:hypothetical protein
MKKRGKLNDGIYGATIISYINLTSIIYFMYDPTSPNGVNQVTPLGLLCLIGINFFAWIILYPFAKWIYREMDGGRKEK